MPSPINFRRPATLRPPERVSRLAARTPVQFGVRLARQIQRDDVVGLAAELAYRWFLSIFPFAIFLAGLGAFIAAQLSVQNPAQAAKDQLTGLLPQEAAILLGDELERIVRNQNPAIISFGILAAIWFATGGMNAVIKALNRAFNVEESRPLWRRYPLAVGLTLLAGIGLLGGLLLSLVGQLVARDVADALGIAETVRPFLSLVRWVIAGSLLATAITVIYHVGPNTELPWRSSLPGAIVFTLAWLAATFGLTYYVSNFGNYDVTYGALAGAVLILLWLYVTALVLLVGAEINDVLVEMREPGAPAAHSPGGAAKLRAGLD